MVIDQHGLLVQRKVFNQKETLVPTRLNITYLVSAAVLFSASASVAQEKSNWKTEATSKQTKQEKVRAVLGSIPGVRFAKELPLNFPIPPYKSNVEKTSFSHSTKGSPTAAATIITKDSAKTVFEWYQDRCKEAGWRVKIPTSQAMSKIGKEGQMYMIDARKENQQLYVFCISNSGKAGTTISISWSKI